MNELPAFVRPGYTLATSGLVEMWIKDCIEFEEGSNLPSKEYLKSFQEWSDRPYTIRSLNKVLWKLGFYVGKVVWIGGKTYRCWVNVSLKEDYEDLVV